MNLTNEELDLIIRKADLAYDKLTSVSGKHESYHTIIENIASCELGIEDFDIEVIDEHCLEIGDEELEDMLSYYECQLDETHWEG